MIFGWRKGRTQSQPLFATPAEVKGRRDSKDRSAGDWSPATRAIYAVASVATLASISQNVGGAAFSNQTEWQGQDVFEKQVEQHGRDR